MIIKCKSCGKKIFKKHNSHLYCIICIKDRRKTLQYLNRHMKKPTCMFQQGNFCTHQIFNINKNTNRRAMCNMKIKDKCMCFKPTDKELYELYKIYKNKMEKK